VRAPPGVAAVLPATSAGELMRVGVVLADPADSPAAERTVQRLRDALHAIPGADALDDCFRIGLRVSSRDNWSEGAESRRC
jgi:hypothetical protein